MLEEAQIKKMKRYIQKTDLELHTGVYTEWDTGCWEEVLETSLETFA